MISLLNILMYAVEIYTGLLLVYALLSWFPGAYESGFGRLLTKICEPYLSLFRRLPLQIGPIDFSVLVAMIVLQLVSNGIIKFILNLMYY